MFKTIEGLTYDFKGDLFIDIGANIGMWSTQLVDLYNRIIYIEPGIDALTTGKIQLAEICRQKNIPFENITFLKNLIRILAVVASLLKFCTLLQTV